MIGRLATVSLLVALLFSYHLVTAQKQVIELELGGVRRLRTSSSAWKARLELVDRGRAQASSRFLVTDPAAELEVVCARVRFRYGIDSSFRGV